jgi:hypothetical protein
LAGLRAALRTVLRVVLRAVDFLAVRRAGAFLTFRFTALLAIVFSLSVSVYLSLRFESPSNKKMMCKFEDFVDSKLHNLSCERVYSIERVARNPQFSRLSNALARHLHISPPLAADLLHGE